MATTNAVASSAATNLPTTTETVVLTFTIPPENNPGGEGVQIDANADFTAGTAATSAILRVRQGSLAGAVVGNAIQSPVTAGIPNSLSGCVLDPTLQYPVGNTYVLTVQQVAATGNGTMAYAAAFSNPCTSQVG